MAGAGAVVGLGLGAWKFLNWGRKKYKTAKALRKAKEQREEAQRRGFFSKQKGFGSDIRSILTRGKSKMGKELMVEQQQQGMSALKMIQSNPAMKRQLMAKQLLRNIHVGGATECEARRLFEALKLPKKARKMILEDRNAAKNDNFVSHVMQKMRGA